MVYKEILREISEKLYSLLVVNQYAAGIQQPDGKYITRYFPVTPFVIENMLLNQGSMGCYQQGYKTNYIKWICLDFDCKDKQNPDLNKLYHRAIQPITELLESLNINYLTEFSGRRGIHIWIIFDSIIKKAKGYQILQKLLNLCDLSDIDQEIWNLDKFPATDSSKGNIVGKQVKFPLSCHKSGSQSYFFQGEFIEELDIGEEEFWYKQLLILEGYKENDLKVIEECLDLDSEVDSEEIGCKYHQYMLLDTIPITVDQTIELLGQTRVFSNIFSRMVRGQAHPRDWTVLLGTLAGCDEKSELLKSMFMRFPNYDETKTVANIAKLSEQYFPATFRYLYHLYDLPMEDGLDPNETGFHYLLREAGFENRAIEKYVAWNEKKVIIDIKNTILKEQNYFRENDEVIDILLWNHLGNLKEYDCCYFNKLIDQAVEGKVEDCIEPDYLLYRRKESATKTRTLISLSVRDRIVTTHLAIMLYEKLQNKWESYSYHVSLTSRNQIFYQWFSSWKRYICEIRTFLEVPFMQNYEVFYIDLKGFYDHVDFLTVYNTFKKDLINESANIFQYLVRYNDKLMKKIRGGCRIGVPQGPAYARIVAEMFLDKVLKKAYKGFDLDLFHEYRYVDDIVIFCNPELDGKALYQNIWNTLLTYGLPCNLEKSQYMGSVSELSRQQHSILLHADKMTYDLSETDFRGPLLPFERKEILREYLLNHEFDIGMISYIFGRKTFIDAQYWFIEHHAKDIFGSEIGRGSSFRKFYSYLFRHEDICKKCLEKGFFETIPIGTINFSNFLSELYIFLQSQEISFELFEDLKIGYLKKLSKDELDKRTRDVWSALINFEQETSDEY